MTKTAPAIDKTRPLPRPRRLPTVLTRPEVTTLLARANPHSLTEHHDRCCMPLMRHAGLRAAEVLALIAYDLDWVSGQRAVPQGKGMKDRILWRHEILLEGLRFSRARPPARSTGLLFPIRLGTPVYRAALRAMVEWRSQKTWLGHKDIHPHMLRHTVVFSRGRAPLVQAHKALFAKR